MLKNYDCFAPCIIPFCESYYTDNVKTPEELQNYWHCEHCLQWYEIDRNIQFPSSPGEPIKLSMKKCENPYHDYQDESL